MKATRKPRPSKDERISFRLTPEQKKKLASAALAASKYPGEFVRDVVLREIGCSEAA